MSSARGMSADGALARGVVSAYDSAAGIGTITVSAGDVVPFQCIGIADGTREIDVGTEVCFVPLARLGRSEATAITTVAAPPSADHAFSA